MEKYTVDLDKVLNDFEYSEYSIESSAKFRQNEPNCAFSHSGSSRTETTVKHSINNVFHSLNEYLSSEISPKKTATTKIQCQTETVSQNGHRKLERIEPFRADKLASNTAKNVENSVVECLAEELGEVAEEKTEIIDSVENFHKVGVDTMDEKNEEILIQIGENDAEFNSERNQFKMSQALSLEGEKIGIESEEKVQILENLCRSETLLIQEKSEEMNDEQKSVKIAQIGEDVVPKIEEKSEEIMEVKQVGFSNDIELDEENLDQYFEALEQELGIEIQQEMDTKIMEDTPIEIQHQSEEKILEIIPKSISVEHKTELTELKNSETELLSSQSELDDEKPELATPVEKIKLVAPPSEEAKLVSPPPEETKVVSPPVEEPNLAPPHEKPEPTSHVEEISTNQITENCDATSSVETCKNHRPQNLTLTEENSTRKISLVGSPGSTPYNNVYSTDLNTKLKEKEAEVSNARPVSPSYSDVSTDSISSHSDTESQQKVVEIQDNSVTSTENVDENNPENAQGNIESNSGGVSYEETNVSSIDWLGKQAPLWIPDNEATSCLHCDMKFTVIKRRHHCRACGLVLCSKCCNLKYRLEYLQDDARVCVKCYEILNKDNVSSGSERSQEVSSSPNRSANSTTSTSLGQPNPNNPLEYCSTVPPLQQIDANQPVATPSVMVPVGVLKRKGSNKGRSNKSVMFCDGIRPGSDLTNLDSDFNYSDSKNKGEKSKKSPERSVMKNLDFFDRETRSFLPSDEKYLPPIVTISKTDIKYTQCVNDESLVEILRKDSLTFALHSNVYIHLKIVDMECCVKTKVWCFSTEGLINVGQDEIVILLEIMEDETLVPREIFVHLNNIYQETVKGSSVKELGLSLHQTSPFLGSKNHAGFIYIRRTFQCLQNILVPKEPYLVGILIHRWETPWAKLFPLRLVLRLGAEYKYYPCPIISTRERDSVFVDIGHTIINLLADFRNFTYTLPQIRGLTIHMEDKNTTVTIPMNRYDQVLKGLSNSSDHILAFAGNFSTSADSHLVCIQDTQTTTNNYSTHAINIANKPRKITGASFIVFNGALKSTSGLTAKSNIVEDGLMIQILPEHMLQVRESLKNMKNHVIKCGCVNETSDETVTILWGESDTSFNVGVISPIDNKQMTGIPSIRVHNGKDYTCNSGNRLIRWTEVFIIQNGNELTPRNQETVDISKISENLAKATCQALVKYLELLVSNSFYKIGIRANLHVENVSYSAGSNNVRLPPIYMKSLDNELIPVLHRIASNNITEQPIIIELIFRILNV